ncbi:hypothetical protein HLH12_13700 [Acinetobacter sp. NIPH 2377]|uniref:hypothetical protein n=1 Tax=Acinetobacter terrestris TaxID=2529843 RepID=UPI0014906D7D|nr:hypothetical protein [Acinetobacter terrestris]NNH36569.1 hypothetical protein [Acinetobacter terrestris]
MAAASLGRLTLDLVAKISNFTGPIRDAERQTESSFANMRKHVNTYGLAVVGAAAGAVTALAAMALETSNQAAELEIFAFRANTTTQEFQKMAVGAQAFGIEAETLSGMMKDFNEKLGELTAVGAGGGVDFFEQIAVKTEGSSEAAKKLILDMQKLSGPEALQMYVDKLEEAGVTQQQMSFYLESMASDLTDLYPLLANGGEGLRLYGDMAERAGIIMTDQTIESAKALKDQVYMLDLQMQGAKNQLMQAVIPAFVDIAEAFLGGSEQGLQFAGVAEGVAKTLKGVATIALGAVAAVQLVGKALGGMAAVGGAIYSNKDWYEMGPLGYAKAAYDARGEIAAITGAMKDDMNGVAEDYMRRYDTIWDGKASGKAEQLRGIRELNQGVGDTNSGLSELADKQNEAAKATKVNTKANSELNKILEDRKRILYEFSSAEDQLKMDLDSQVSGLSKAGMQNLIPIAKARYAEEKKLAELRFAWEVAEHRFTEDEKLNYSYAVKRQEILTDTKLSADQQKLKLQALREVTAQESKMLEITQAKELLQTKQLWMTAGEYAQEYYALVRAEILNTPSYSPEMKQAFVKEANFSQGMDQNAEREQVWGDYKSMMGLDESPYQQDMNLLTEAREQMLITEELYQQQRLGMQLKYGSQYGSDFAGMMMGLVDQSSSAYAILYGVQKGFNLASAIMNGYAAISAAWASAPFPYNLPAVAVATMETGVLQAAISAVSPVGMAHDGIDNIPKEGTWLLDGGERVLNPNQNKDLTNYLSQAQSNSGQQSQGQQFTIVNQIEQDDLVGNYMRGATGGQIVLNQIKANPSDFKAALGIS